MKTRFFRFGQLRQERGDKHVRNGDLVSATNVCQTAKAGTYPKRKGFGMTSLAFSGATWGAATVSSCVPALSGAGALMRDSLDRVWAYDGSAASPTWTYRGEHKRVWVDTKIVDSRRYTRPQVTTVDAGDNIWVFARGSNAYSPSAGQDGYYLSVVKKSNGDIVYASPAFLADNIINMAACYDGTSVWLFWIDGTTKVYSNKFTAATPAAPATYTYTTAGVNIQSIAAHYCSGATAVLVAYGGNDGSTARLYHAGLNTGTGAAVSPQSVVNAACALPVQGIGFFQSQTSATTVYYHYYGFQVGGSGATYSGPAVVTITVSDLSFTISNGPDGALVGSATDAVVATGICGIDITGTGSILDFVIYYRKGGLAMILAVQNGTILNGGSFPAMSGTSNSFLHGWWLASSMVKVGSYVYWLVGNDDVNMSSVPTGTALLSEEYSTQRVFNVYCMKETDFYGLSWGSSSYGPKIVGQFLSGQAAGQFHNYAHTAIVSPSPAFYTCSVPLLTVSGTNLVGMVASKVGSIDTVELSYVKVDTAKTWGKDVYADGRGVSPGGIPVVWSRSDNMHEMSPMLAPSYVSVSDAGTGTDYASAAAVYVIRDSDGRVWRSSPYVLSAAFGTGGTLLIPTLFSLFPTSKAYIEIYIGTTATPKLQVTVANPYIPGSGAAPSACYSYTTPVLASYLSTGETLYTMGGSLSQSWPPQCQSVGTWGQRLLLGAKNVLWASQEFSSGGFLFNEVARSTWSECLGDINAIRTVDANYCAVISKPGVGLISGPGPDGRGAGNYSIKPVPTETGLNAGGVAFDGEGGCFFQDASTGRLVVITNQDQVVECAGGARDLSTETITAINCQESERQIHFHTASNHIIVLDYQHKMESALFGQVYVWTPAVVAYAAAKDSTGPFYVGSNGAIYRLGATYRDTNAAGASVDYRMDVKTAQLQFEDLQGEFDVSRVQVLGTFKAAFSATITTYPDYATSGATTAAAAIAAAPFQLATKPPSCMRVQALQLQITETVGTGAAFEFEGFAVDYIDRGKMKHLNTSQVVT